VGAFGHAYGQASQHLTRRHTHERLGHSLGLADLYQYPTRQCETVNFENVEPHGKKKK